MKDVKTVWKPLSNALGRNKFKGQEDMGQKKLILLECNMTCLTGQQNGTKDDISLHQFHHLRFLVASFPTMYYQSMFQRKEEYVFQSIVSF